MIMIPRECKCY